MKVLEHIIARIVKEAKRDQTKTALASVVESLTNLEQFLKTAQILATRRSKVKLSIGLTAF
jgi:hypothetical protein